jgi:hypothetical protein
MAAKPNANVLANAIGPALRLSNQEIAAPTTIKQVIFGSNPRFCHDS